MCGRYSLTKPIKTLQEHFRAAVLGLDHQARYNIAPSQVAPVVVAVDSGRELRGMRWGLIPSWAKDEKIGQRLINARAETLDQKPSFKSSFVRRRCLVPADGFYEWQERDKIKVPFYIHRPSQELFAFAGLWSEWRGAGKIVHSFTIITTDASRQLQPLHSRMPVILPPDHYAPWLDRDASQDSLKALLQPFKENGLVYYEVSRAVNSPKHDGPECIEPAQNGDSDAGGVS